MDYAAAEGFLDDRAKWGMRPGTERIAAITEALDRPQDTYPVIHVAGTNGKFSVASMITSILGSLGLTVGTYTSPHLERVTERIAIAGEPIADEDFAAVLAYLRPYLELVEAERDDHLTYFEVLTAMAFEWFFDRSVHVAVLETGLGGEYDATNVADASVSVITNVGADHLNVFGDLETAAWEKAGVIKPGATVVTGVEPGDLLAIVADRARDRDATLLALGADVEAVTRAPAVGGQSVTIRTPSGIYPDLFVPAFGAHQATNAALAVAACEAFAGEALAREPLADGLALVKLTGRMEVVGRRPLVVIDGAHNPPGARAASETIREAFDYVRLIGVTAMVGDKDVDDVMTIMAPVLDRAIVAAVNDDRTAPADVVREALERGGLTDVSTRGSVAEALSDAIEEASDDDLVFVFGSLYTVGEALAWLRSTGALPQG